MMFAGRYRRPASGRPRKKQTAAGKPRPMSGHTGMSSGGMSGSETDGRAPMREESPWGMRPYGANRPIKYPKDLDETSQDEDETSMGETSMDEETEFDDSKPAIPVYYILDTNTADRDTTPGAQDVIQGGTHSIDVLTTGSGESPSGIIIRQKPAQMPGVEENVDPVINDPGRLYRIEENEHQKDEDEDGDIGDSGLSVGDEKSAGPEVELPLPPPPKNSGKGIAWGRWVRLNIGGVKYYTTYHSLSRKPESKLAKLITGDTIPQGVEREYRFDRNPHIFGFILDYYRTGELHMPQGVCVPFFCAELQFWGIPSSALAPCCWEKYSTYSEDQKVMAKIDDPVEVLEPKDMLPGFAANCHTNREKIWHILEYPSSSLWAQIWSLLYIFIILISTFALIVDTHVDFRVAAEADRVRNANETNPKRIMLETTDSHPGILVVELITTLIFSVELITRLLVCPNKLSFLLGFFNWADLISIIAEWAVLFLVTMTEYWNDDTLWTTYRAFAFLRIFRVLRLFRLARHYEGLQIFLLAMKASAKEVFLLGVIILVWVIIYATCIFYAEFNTEGEFKSIPHSFWWAVVTMTTVGYGDTYPHSGWGYLVGALCAVTGMLSTGLPIPIIATNFQMFYVYAKMKKRIDKQEEQVSLTRKIYEKAVSKLARKEKPPPPPNRYPNPYPDIAIPEDQASSDKPAASDKAASEGDHVDTPKGSPEPPSAGNFMYPNKSEDLYSKNSPDALYGKDEKTNVLDSSEEQAKNSTTTNGNTSETSTGNSKPNEQNGSVSSSGNSSETGSTSTVTNNSKSKNKVGNSEKA